MRHVSFAGLLGLLWLAASPAFANNDYRWYDHEYGQDYRGPGYRGPDYRGPDYRGRYPQKDSRHNLPITTVAEARRLADDSRIILSGYIVRQLDDDEFLFKDNTGTIRIEMDKDDWRKLRRHGRGEILIWAEVERDKRRVTLEVKRARPVWR